MLFFSIDTIAQWLKDQGLANVFPGIIDHLEADFRRWPDFHKSARHATYYPDGVIELMPCADQDYYAFKYVNGHPNNPALGKLNVLALGVLADAHTGYPLLISEMTLLTAVRTAATAALAARYLARQDSQRIALIGTGAQAEFVTWALSTQYQGCQVHYYDTDPQAMRKYHDNLAASSIPVFPADSIAAAIHDADIIVTATAAKCRADLIQSVMLSPGQCYLGLGGDCPGKSEFSPEVLQQCKIVVEYLPQSLVEGEIQNLGPDSVHAELWELIAGTKKGRATPVEITLFDSVGFALEDYSILTWLYKLAENGDIRPESVLAIVPDLADPKDLYGLVKA